MAGDGERGSDELARTATASDAKSDMAGDVEALASTLGRYKLERELGAGGMGVVHAAFDPDLERRVALKVLLKAGSGESRQRLLREARALARLTHPNVVTVHEVGSANGRDYVAMELIEGETLADWLRGATRSPHDIVTAFVAAGRGLAAAHAAGLVHRDFKPHNVLRRKDGRIVVTDFGLARGIEVAIELETTLRLKSTQSSDDNTPSPLTGLTQTGSVLGTPAYMAPEQWSGENVGPAADQFAFCVAVWEALAGERPFRGLTLDELQAAVRRGPAELDDSKLPRRLRAPLKRGLDPDARKRWPSMDALLAAITRAERPRGVWLMLAGAMVVAAAVAYAVFAIEDKPKVVAAACEPPVLDPAAVWSPSLANEVRDKSSSAVMRRLDATIGGWQQARTVACGLDAPLRARQLACLDGVIARFDAVRKASVYRTKPSLDEISYQLIDPGVCNVEDPPRLPTRLSDAAVAALSLAYEPEAQATFDDSMEADVLAKAGDDRCARGFARLARVVRDDSAKAHEAVDEAVQLADACGDDRARADALLEQLAMQVTLFVDPKLQKALARADAAVRKVAQPDVVAALDLVKAAIANNSGQWDECIKLSDSAVRGLGDLRPKARIEAVAMKVKALSTRRQPGDFEAARAELARWRPEAERLDASRVLVRLDTLDVDLQWSLGDVAGANARLPDLLKRIEASRVKPPEGEPLSGIVVNAKGRPVAGATVAAGNAVVADSISIGYLENRGDTRIGTTDAQGRFALDRVPRDAVVVAQLGDQRSIVRTAKDGDRIVLQPTTTISGKVTGGDPSKLTVFVLNGDRGTSPMYQVQAPVAADGSFTVKGVPIGHVRVGAAILGAALGQALTIQDVTVGPKGLSNIEVKRAENRKLRVLVRSSAEVPLSGAQVFVAAGSVSIKAVKEIEVLLRAPGLAVELTRPLMGGEPPPELGKVVPGDTVATFANAPVGAATACALGLSGDFSDPAFREKLQRHINELEIRCVPVAPDAKAVTVEVPPMKRLD